MYNSTSYVKNIKGEQSICIERKSFSGDKFACYLPIEKAYVVLEDRDLLSCARHMSIVLGLYEATNEKIFKIADIILKHVEEMLILAPESAGDEKRRKLLEDKIRGYKMECTVTIDGKEHEFVM